MRNIFFLILSSLGALSLSSCGENSVSEKLILTGSSTVAPLAADIAKRFEAENPGVRIEVQTGGSSRGISDAASGLADIGMASRDLKDGENELSSHAIAVDGIALIVHNENPVTNLTRDQILSIFVGKINNWSEVGGPDQEIVVVNKAEGRGTLEVFLKYFGLDSADIQSDLIVGENQQAIKTIAGNTAAIGYVSIGAGEYEAQNGTPIRLLSVDGKAPNSTTVADGTYPISRPLLLITRGDPTGLGLKFIKFARTEQVHDLVEEHLYVPVKN